MPHMGIRILALVESLAASKANTVITLVPKVGCCCESRMLSFVERFYCTITIEHTITVFLSVWHIQKKSFSLTSVTM